MKRKSQIWQHMQTIGLNRWAIHGAIPAITDTVNFVSWCWNHWSLCWKRSSLRIIVVWSTVLLFANKSAEYLLEFVLRLLRFSSEKRRLGACLVANWPRCASGNGPQMVMVVTMMATMMVTMNWWWLWWWLWWWQWWQWGACLVALCQGIPLVMAPQMADAWLPKLRSVNKGRHFGANDNCDNQYLDQMCFHLNCPPRLWKWPSTVLRWYIWTCTA